MLDKNKKCDGGEKKGDGAGGGGNPNMQNMHE